MSSFWNEDLFSAAPDMYEALKAVVRADASKDWPRVWELARAALEKAGYKEDEE